MRSYSSLADGNRYLKAVFQWYVLLRTCAQYASMNEFTCSDHYVRKKKTQHWETAFSSTTGGSIYKITFWKCELWLAKSRVCETVCVKTVCENIIRIEYAIMNSMENFCFSKEDYFQLQFSEAIKIALIYTNFIKFHSSCRFLPLLRPTFRFRGEFYSLRKSYIKFDIKTQKLHQILKMFCVKF